MGGTYGGRAFLILHLLAFPFLRQSNYTLHCIALPQTKRLRRLKIYSDSQQYPSKLCLINIKYSCFPFLKLIIFICGFSTKVTRAFLASETMEKRIGFKGTSEIPLYKWRVALEITNVFHLSIITPYGKKYFKISLLPITKKVSL